MAKNRSNEIKLKNKYIILATMYQYRFFKSSIFTEILTLSKGTVHNYLWNLQEEQYVIQDNRVLGIQAIGRIPINYKFNSEIGFVIIIIDTSKELSMLITNVYAELKFKINLDNQSEEYVVSKVIDLSSRLLGTSRGLLGVMHITDRSSRQPFKLDKLNSVYCHKYDDDCLASYHFSHTADKSLITVLKYDNHIFFKWHIRNRKNEQEENYQSLPIDKNIGVMIKRHLYNMYQLTDPFATITEETIRPFFDADSKRKIIYLDKHSIRRQILEEGVRQMVVSFLDKIT